LRAGAKPISIAISILIAVFVATTAAFSGLTVENRLLESELKLAEKSNIYFIFNLEENKAQIKAKGVPLKEFPIGGSRLWGGSPTTTPLRLVKKSALLEPKRRTITPKKREEQSSEEDTGAPTFEIEALELKDMPSSFRFELSAGVHILIRPKPEGFLMGLLDIFRTLVWYVTKPIQSLWHAFLGTPFTALELELGRDDAQRLYWSFPEGNEVIVYRPIA